VILAPAIMSEVISALIVGQVFVSQSVDRIDRSRSWMRPLVVDVGD